MAGARSELIDRKRLRRRRRWGAWLPVGVVLLVLATAFASFQFDLASRLGLVPDEGPDPAVVEPPDGLELPELVAPEALALAAGQAGPVSVEKVRRALAPFTQLPELGPHRVFAVGSPEGETYYATRSGTAVPASTMKILTGVAALQALDADRTFSTTVRVGATPEEIVIVGGGDPYLMRRAEKGAYPRQADLVSLAARTASALEEAGVTTVRLGFDDSLFTGPRVSPDWPVDYITDSVVSPITALFIDQGHREDGPGFVGEPARAAAVAFAEELAKQGITVRGEPDRTVAPAAVAPSGSVDEEAADDTDGVADGDTDGDTDQGAGEVAIDPTADPAQVLVPGLELAAVHSAPVWQLVSRMLAISDNEGAELLAHHVAIELGAEPSFEGASIAVETALERLGVDLSGELILDGSGLSRGNRLSAATLLDVLELAAAPEHPQLRPVITGLPIAGFTGSLARRYVQTPDAAAGRVRAKTGTLTGVHGLAGITTDLDGNVFTFAFLADKVKVPNTLAARAALEQLTAALAACHCSS